jgi:hypothetical protein
MMVIKIPANGTIYEETIDPNDFDMKLFEASDLMKMKVNATQEGILKKSSKTDLSILKNREVADMLNSKYLNYQVSFYVE